MNLPSGKLMALVAVFAAIGIITGTGAFTTVSAERTAEVNVAGDASALLQLDATSRYAQYDGGVLEIVFEDNNGNEIGVNDEAVTVVNNVFSITNNGQQEVNVTIEVGYNNTDLGEVVFANSTFDSGNGFSTNDADGVSMSKGVVIGSGNQTNVSMKINTRKGSGTLSSESDSKRLIDNVTIIANKTG